MTNSPQKMTNLPQKIAILPPNMANFTPKMAHFPQFYGRADCDRDGRSALCDDGDRAVWAGAHGVGGSGWVAVADGVAVAQWQWNHWIGGALAVILSGDKLGIGEFLTEL
jgi:hypothetical protein